MEKESKEIAVFGGGCFWCAEAVFKMVRGVASVVPGYAGGVPPANGRNPTYEEVRSGKTRHAEVIRIEYDPEKISFRDLLAVFFGSHDPTAKNRQGNDVGVQYRSVIFYSTPGQKKETDSFIGEINESHTAGAPVLTEVAPLEKFYEAENEHRDYFSKNAGSPYCEVVINPKLEKVKRLFAELLNGAPKRYNDTG
ncbi:MAG: peptide-methionine (S)-S-oxide reductase MsrA [Patescibacteria group bacterium]